MSDRGRSDLVFQFKSVAAISAIIATQLVPGHLSLLGWMVLATWALTSPVGAVRAILVAILLTFLNPGLFNVEGATSFRWFVLICAGGRVAFAVAFERTYTIRRADVSWVPGFALFCLAAFLSVIASRVPVLSLLKLLAFVFGFLSIVFGVLVTRNYPWVLWLRALLLSIVVWSVPLIASPIGYWLNRISFQGILNQPQAIGTFLASGTAFFGARFLIRPVNRWFDGVIAVSSFGLVFLSHARTAFLAILIGLVGCGGFLLIRKMADASSNRFRVRTSTVGIVLILFAAMAPVVSSSVFVARDFLMKAVRPNGVFMSESVTESLLRSRRGLVSKQITNFIENPLVGIGFGVASDRDIYVNGSAGGLIPISAPTEKGVIVTAVLEETGIFGFVGFLSFLVTTAVVVSRKASAPGVALFLTTIAINFGEMVFFSVGAFGAYVAFYIGLSLANQESYRRNMIDTQAQARPALHA